MSLEVTIVEGSALRNLEAGKKGLFTKKSKSSDPYVVLEYEGQK